MITIYSVLLVALGFLCAVLFGLFIAPAYKKRVARLTTQQIKRSMPITEAEIRADKDQLRADFALVIHDLESKLEAGTLSAARQRIEINRRDAAISRLEGDVNGLKTSLEEHENARRVLEHTIMDRLPKLEQRLSEARKLLNQRDREIAVLSATAEKQGTALDQATQINTQNRDEIHRLNAALATRAARNRDGYSDQRFDGEVALRAELEALRAKTRDQAAHVTRLEGLVGRKAGSIGTPVASAVSGSAGSDRDRLSTKQAEVQIAKLRADLAEAEAALRSERSTSEAGLEGRQELEKELASIKATNEDLRAETARVKATLQAYQDFEKDERAIGDSKLDMKARIAALQAEGKEQSETIAKLRAEIAAANERMAKQAALFMDEMRRVGAGTVPTSSRIRTGNRSSKRSGEERVSLSERISDPSTIRSKIERSSGRTSETGSGDAPVSEGAQSSRVSGFLRALGGGFGISGSPDKAGSDVAAGANGDVAVAEKSNAGGDGKSVEVGKRKVASNGDGATAAVKKEEKQPEAVGAGLAAEDKPSSDADQLPKKRRAGGLLDRITRLDRAE